MTVKQFLLTKSSKTKPHQLNALMDHDISYYGIHTVAELYKNLLTIQIGGQKS